MRIPLCGPGERRPGVPHTPPVRKTPHFSLCETDALLLCSGAGRARSDSGHQAHHHGHGGDCCGHAPAPAPAPAPRPGRPGPQRGDSSRQLWDSMELEKTPARGPPTRRSRPAPRPAPPREEEGRARAPSWQNSLRGAGPARQSVSPPRRRSENR